VSDHGLGYQPVVDLSRYQGKVDFRHMKAVGVHGTIIRIGDELSGLQPSDPKFREYVSGALDAGLEVGTYMFCRPNRGNASDFGKRYGNAVVTSFPGVTFSLGHFPDHENFWGVGSCPLSPDQYDRWIWDHSAALDDATGVQSGLYSGQSFWNVYVRSTRHSFRKFWQARYPYGRTLAPTNPTPDLDDVPNDWADWALRSAPQPPMGWDHWSVWQFSSAGPGSYYGVSSLGLDLNLYREDVLPTPIPIPIPPHPDQENDVRVIVAVPNSNPLPNGRWPHWRLTGEHIISANGAPALQGSVPVFGVPTVELPKGHRPILGIEPSPDGNGVIAYADDQGTFTFRVA
jgi:GH25 family lysozyme M1 (1,4-beta-N-acetylmuramidase)